MKISTIKEVELASKQWAAGRTLRECANASSIPWQIVEDYCVQILDLSVFTPDKWYWAGEIHIKSTENRISFAFPVSATKVLKDIIRCGLVKEYWDGRFAA